MLGQVSTPPSISVAAPEGPSVNSHASDGMVLRHLGIEVQRTARE